MIATVTVNPCIDKTVTVNGFDKNKVNRVKVVSIDAAGKGINVARTLHLLGESVVCTGFDFCAENDADETSEISRRLSADGIVWEPVRVNGRTRVCMKILDEQDLHTIEINEYGSSVGMDECEALLSKLEALAPKMNIMN